MRSKNLPSYAYVITFSTKKHSIFSVQVHDIPPIKIIVTEHRGEHKDCPNCGRYNRAEFPPEVQYPVQYGQNLKVLMVYLCIYPLLRYKRLCEPFIDLFRRLMSICILSNDRIEWGEYGKRITPHPLYPTLPESGPIDEGITASVGYRSLYTPSGSISRSCFFKTQNRLRYVEGGFSLFSRVIISYPTNLAWS